MRGLSVVALLAGCKAGPVSGGVTTGAITSPVHGDPQLVMAEAPGASDSTNGVEFRAFMSGAFKDAAIPNAYGVSIRQLGTGVQTSLQTGYMVALPAGSTMVFGRLMVDLLSSTRFDEDHTMLSGLSPTFDVGFAPFGHGICISASTTWDVRFNNPDRMIIGGYFGLCGGALRRD